MDGVWKAVGWVFLGLAVVGTALPIMPTVPFLLVAAWAFQKSSPRLRQRIRRDPRYGAMVRAWQDYGVVPRFAKIWSVVTMSFGVGLALWLGVAAGIVAVQATVCLLIGIYLVTRPEVVRSRSQKSPLS